MDPIRYAVLAVDSEWRVVSARRQIGQFPTYGLALEVAVRSAFEAARSGCRVEILYADQGAELHAIQIPAQGLSPSRGRLPAQSPSPVAAPGPA